LEVEKSLPKCFVRDDDDLFDEEFRASSSSNNLIVDPTAFEAVKINLDKNVR
jgi:hypothetical protein